MVSQSIPQYAAHALAMSVKDWTKLGLRDGDEATTATSDMSVLVERVTSLLLIRLVAIVSPPHSYADLSTTTICRTALMRQEHWGLPITDDIVSQLRQYVRTILTQYKDVPYHNYEHAFHVVLSCNKLMDLMLQERKTQTFGLRRDPLLLFSLIFAALIHDVEHQGLPNRQLSAENDSLAILYNDQSIAENRSLYLAFSELLKDDYEDLRAILFRPIKCMTSAEEYLRFRKQVVQLVLITDIASPERTQLAKSKFKEAFGSQAAVEENGDATEQHDASLSSSDPSDAIEESDDTIEEGDEESDESSILEQINKVFTEVKEGDKHDDSKSCSIGADSNEDQDEPPRRSWSMYNESTSSSFKLGRDEMRESLISTSPRRQRRVPRRPNSLFARPPENPDASMSDSVRSHTSGQRFPRRRLGLRMSMDLSGEALETYTRYGLGNSVHNAGGSADDEEEDEFKGSVVLELMLTAADVAHNLQGWPQMVKWSGRLYMELQRAFVAGRGTDPQPRWYENQIGFLEMYLLPLAKRLDETGVFGQYTGKMFAQAIVSNRDKWLKQGMKVTMDIVAAGEKIVCVVEEKKAAALAVAAQEEEGAKQEPREQVDEPKQMDEPKPVDIQPCGVQPSVQPGVQPNVQPSVNDFSTIKERNEVATNHLYWIVAIATMLLAIVSKTAAKGVQLQPSLALRRGQIVPTGTWISKCGLLLRMVSSCEDAFLHVGYNGFVTLFDAELRVIWELQGSSCDRNDNTACVMGMKFTDDWHIQVGEERVKTVDIYLKTDLVPWPFAYNPVVRRRDVSARLLGDDSQSEDVLSSDV